MARSFDSGNAVAWRRRVRRFGRSELTVVRFCEKEGVSTASFYRWRNRFSNEPAKTGAFRAVRNDLDVWAYVKDVLDQLLAGWTDYHALRPDIWRASHGESIRTYRTRERRDRADRKQRRRAQRRIANAASR